MFLVRKAKCAEGVCPTQTIGDTDLQCQWLTTGASALPLPPSFVRSTVSAEYLLKAVAHLYDAGKQKAATGCIFCVTSSPCCVFGILWNFFAVRDCTWCGIWLPLLRSAVVLLWATNSSLHLCRSHTILVSAHWRTSQFPYSTSNISYTVHSHIHSKCYTWSQVSVVLSRASCKWQEERTDNGVAQEYDVTARGMLLRNVSENFGMEISSNFNSATSMHIGRPVWCLCPCKLKSC